MFYTIAQVKVGLTKGYSFKRHFGSEIRPKCEYVRSLGNNRFEHIVDGGVAELDISFLDTTRWNEEHWELWEEE